MKIYVTGFNHLSGTSKKTGNDYDFYQVESLSKRNSGFGSPLMTSVMAIQAPAYENILASFVNASASFPVLLNAEFDNRGNLVEAEFISSGDEAASSLVDTLLA